MPADSGDAVTYPRSELIVRVAGPTESLVDFVPVLGEVLDGMTPVLRIVEGLGGTLQVTLDCVDITDQLDPGGEVVADMTDLIGPPAPGEGGALEHG